MTGRQADTRTAPGGRALLVSWFPRLLVFALFLGFLALYWRTAAPSVLSGDSAEFQFAAPLLGVPHPTTYPLYVLLGKLATLIPLADDLARRVTLVSAGCAALAVALFFLLARRLSATPPAMVAALLFGFAPGLWNAATLAEVYALLMVLLVGLCCLIAPAVARQAIPGDDRPVPFAGAAQSWWWLRGAAFVAGLGLTHHGLFVIAGLPLFLGAIAAFALLGRPDSSVSLDQGRAPSDQRGLILRLAPAGIHGPDLLKQLGILALCLAAGMTPWLYPLIQYTRYGPFDGMDYGLPRHYFWGSPTSWGAVIDLLTGGAIRRGIFTLPSIPSALATLRLVGGRLLFEFGAAGVLLGLLGCAVMLRRNRVAWLGAAWVCFAILCYLLLLGAAVADAPVFTLPMLLPWALWIVAGLDALLAFLRRRWPVHDRWQLLVLALLVAATLAWGYTRLPYANKRHLWLFRSFGEATLDQLPPGAAVITHWEQGTTLQYLVLAEHRRGDVVIDIDEPGDVAWGTRARQRHADRPVFFVGAASDVAGLPVTLVRADPYADLFQLRR